MRAGSPSRTRTALLVLGLLLVAAVISVPVPSARALSGGVFRDDFQTGNYSGLSPDLPWSGPWTEQDDGVPNSSEGSAKVSDDNRCPDDFCLELGRGDQDAWLWRQTNLSGASSATLSFSYRRHGHGSAQGYVDLAISPNGGSGWTTIDTFWFSGDDPAPVLVSYDINNSFISGNTRVGFFLNNSSSDDSHMNVDDLQIVAGPANVEPILAPIGNKTAAEGDVVSFTATASDDDAGDILTYSLTGSPPSGAGIDPTSGAFTWDTDEADGPGSYIFNVVVSDDGTPSLSDSESITITVDEVNVGPTITPPGNKTDAEDDAISLTLQATDPDAPSNILSWSATGLPPGLSIGATTGTISGQIGSTASAGSPYTVTISVTDDGSPALNDEVSFGWTILNTNKPPLLSAIGSPVANEGTTLSFTATASDPDSGDALTFSLSGAPFGAAINPSTGAFTWTTTENHGPGTYGFTVVVSDNGTPSRSDSESITVTIEETNMAPVLVSPGDQTHADGDAVSVSPSAFDGDSPANVLTWSATGLPPGLSIDPATGVITGIISDIASLGSPYTVAIAVSDDGSPKLQDSVVISWTVGTGFGNGAPAGSDAQVTTEPNIPVRIKLTGLDPDGDEVTMIITKAPELGDLEGDWPNLTYVPDRDVSGVDLFTYVLSDGSATSDTHTVRIAIAADDENLPPVATDDEFHGREGAPLRGSVLDNDFDVEASALLVTLLEGPAHGLVAIDAAGAFEYEPEEGFSGTDTFTYQITDDLGLQASATVTLMIEPVTPTAPPPDPNQVPDPPVSASSATRQSVVAELTGSDRIPVATPEQQSSISRTLVLLTRAGGSSVGNVGLPMAILVLTAVLIAVFGRIGVVPLLRRGEPGTGTVSMYDRDRGFGLVRRDVDGVELFVHQSAIARRWRTKLSPGDRVRYRAVVGSVRDLVTWARPDGAQS